MNKIKVETMTTSVHNMMTVTINDDCYYISGIDSEQDYPLKTRWLLDDLLNQDALLNIDVASGPNGEIYFATYEVEDDKIYDILQVNRETVVKYTTSRTDRPYDIKLSPVSMYAGTYNLAVVLSEYQEKIAKQFDIDYESTDYHPDQLDFDLQELATYALHYLITDNRELVSVKQV